MRFVETDLADEISTQGAVDLSLSVFGRPGGLVNCAEAVAVILPIARELARPAIRAMTMAPSITETPILRSMAPEARVPLGLKLPFPSHLDRPDEDAARPTHDLANALGLVC